MANGISRTEDYEAGVRDRVTQINEACELNQPGELKRGFERLDKALAMANETTNRLAQRLKPVLRASPPDGANKARQADIVDAPQTEYGERLRVIGERADHVARVLGHILERLEL